MPRCMDRVVAVEELLSHQRNLLSSKTSADATNAKRRIVATDRTIDEIVYRLYGLDGADIDLIEAQMEEFAAGAVETDDPGPESPE